MSDPVADLQLNRAKPPKLRSNFRGANDLRVLLDSLEWESAAYAAAAEAYRASGDALGRDGLAIGQELVNVADMLAPVPHGR